MADIPLKSDDEMTNDLVGAVENIAQSVKAGSRDFTKSFTGLTTAIKRLQTTLVNAIKAIKIQVVAKPEKVQKPAIKDKATSTKEVVKEKETKTEVKPEPKSKAPKIEAEKTDVAKQPKLPKVVDPIQAAEKERIKKQKQDDADVRSQKLRDQAKIIALRLEEALKPKPIKEPKAAKEPKPIKEPKAAKEPKPPKVIDPLVEAEKQRKKKRADESAELRLQTQRNNAQLSALRLQSALTPKPEKKAPEPKPLKETKEERQVRSLGVPGTKKFVGPRLEEEDLANEKAKKDKEQADIAAANAAAKAISDAADAAAQAIEDAAKRKEKAEQEEDKALKTLRTYFRNKSKKEAQESAKAAVKEAQESSKAAEDFIKQQQQAARQLEQANQRTQKELDSMIAGFQGLSALFRGPLVNYGLKMIAKGIGYKQPKQMSKGGDVSYLADGGDASGPMKPKGTDTQPAMLTPGEFVVKKDAAKDPENRKQLESINSGRNKKKTEYRASGGSVGGVGYYAAGGSVGSIIASAVVNIGSTVSTIVNAAKSITVVGAASTALGVAFNSITQSVKIANQALAVFGPLVAKANPALMQKLEIVMNDLSGVIGRALIPAVEYLSPLLRKYADYVDYSMKKLTPSINKSAVAFDNVVSPLMDLGAVIYSVIGPVFDGLAVVVVGVSNVLKPIIEFITAFSSALVQTIGVLASPIVSVAMATLGFAFDALTLVIKTTLGIIQTLLGAFVNIVGLIIQGLGKVISYIPLMGDVGKSIAKGGEAISKSGESLKQGKPAEQDRIKKGSSVGAAVREVSSTSIAGVGDEVRKNAMMAASGQKTQEDMLGDISNKLDKNALADAFAEGMKKAKDNKPQTTPPVQIQGKIPGALSKQEQVQLGTV
jgi:hypothetical protein